MQLNQDLPEGYFFVRSCRPEGITVIDRELRRSFIVSPDRVVEDWPVRSMAELDEDGILALLALSPELILLGTGVNQQFAPPALQGLLMARGIGFEVMNNAAACRTYNLLAAEGRRVVAGLMLAN